MKKIPLLIWWDQKMWQPKKVGILKKLFLFTLWDYLPTLNIMTIKNIFDDLLLLELLDANDILKKTFSICNHSEIEYILSRPNIFQLSGQMRI